MVLNMMEQTHIKNLTKDNGFIEPFKNFLSLELVKLYFSEDNFLNEKI